MKIKNINAIRERIANQVDGMDPDDLDERSWGDEKGIIISGNEAMLFSDLLLETIKPVIKAESKIPLSPYPVMVDRKTYEQIIGAQNELLNQFCKFMESEGYLDSDWRTEEPFAIDKFNQFLKTK